MEYHLAVSVPDKAKDVMDIEVTAEGAGDKRHFSFAAFWRPKFLAKFRVGDLVMKSPTLLYYDLANVFSKVSVKPQISIYIKFTLQFSCQGIAFYCYKTVFWMFEEPIAVQKRENEP